MEANSWRPAQGDGPAVDSAGTVDWKSRLQPEARERIVNKMMETFKRHLLPLYLSEGLCLSEGLSEIKKGAFQFEEKIYSAAISQSDYLRKISLKMLSMETKMQLTPPINPAISNSGVMNQTFTDPALMDSAAQMDSTAQTGHTGEIDLEEECYQKIQSSKELYVTELTQFHRKIVQKLQQHEAHMPPGTQSKQFDKLKCFKAMLERTLTLLEISKPNIPAEDKLPVIGL